jgi:hypothetical protein
MAADSLTARKLATLDRGLFDQRVSALDFRVLYYLASATDQNTWMAKRKQRTIAQALHIVTRTVQLALDRLRDLGYIIYETKEGGTYVNAYRIVLVEVNSGSALENKKANRDSAPVSKRRITPDKNTHPEMQKDEAPFVHDLPFNSHNIPSRAPEAGALGILGSMISRRIGVARFEAWLGDARFGCNTGSVGILWLRNQYWCDHVKSQFEQDILDCWRSVDTRKEKVEFHVAPTRTEGR